MSVAKVPGDGGAEPPRPSGSLGDARRAARGVAFLRGDQAEIADKLLASLERLGRPELVFDEGDLYGYDPATGLYSAIPDWYRSQIVKEFAHKPVYSVDPQTGDVVVDEETGRPTVHHRLSLSAAAISGAATIACAQKAHPRFFCDAAAGIAFADSFVRVTEGGLVEEPLSPRHRARCAYPFEFARDERTPLFDLFLHDIFEGDVDLAAKVALVEEAHGVCVAGIATDYERAFIFLGEGANGKSRLLRIIVASMPPGTVVGVAPQFWGDQYQRPLLVGARLNAVAEMPRSEIVDSESLKAIVSGEQICGRHVREKAITFVPRAGHILGANKLPPVSDRADGFWRRWAILEFNRSFEHDPRRDPYIAEKIIAAELPQIVRRALRGAERVMRRRGYTLPISHDFALATWRRATDPVGMFVEARTEAAPEGQGTSSRMLYRALCGWLAHVRPGVRVTETEFGRRMTEKFGKARSSAGNVYPLRLREGA